MAATALLRILFGELCFEGWYIYCPDIFFVVLGINVLSKQVIWFFWFGWFTAVIDFLIDQNISVCEGRVGGILLFLTYYIFIQNLVNVISLGSCSIEKLNFD